MVAAISGPGLGLLNSSTTTLGSSGTQGTPAQGRSGEQVYVNTANGNLVLQDNDELLAAEGLDVSIVRTYNSQGQYNDGLGDNWRLGVQESLYGLTGTVNTAGSTMTKVFGDGSEVTYTYDATQGLYTSSAGGGADNTLSYNANTQDWTWTDGTTRQTETYNSAGLLISCTDTSGNTLTYSYTQGLLTQISDASGQLTNFDYTNGNLTQITTVSAGVTQTLVYYGYDTQGRLSTVSVDLSPGDNSVSDGDTYVTHYTYDGTSDRVASISQSDGTSISFQYIDVDGEYRVQSYTDALGRTTTLTYTSTGATAVTTNANPNSLQTTQTQSEGESASLNNSGLSTTTPQNQSSTAPFNSSGLSDTETGYESGTQPLNTSGLQTSRTEVNSVPVTLNSGALATTETESVNRTATLDGAAVIAEETQGQDQTATLNTAALEYSTTNSQSDSIDENNVSLDPSVTSYTVQSGDTWDSIADTLYNTSDVANALQTALGNPTLTPGAVLTGLPQYLTDDTISASPNSTSYLRSAQKSRRYLELDCASTLWDRRRRLGVGQHVRRHRTDCGSGPEPAAERELPPEPDRAGAAVLLCEVRRYLGHDN